MNGGLNIAHRRCFAETPTHHSSKPRGSFRSRITSFIVGMTVSGGIGAYAFYWNFNDTADQINEAINELGVKFKRDTTKLYKQMDALNEAINELVVKFKRDTTKLYKQMD